VIRSFASRATADIYNGIESVRARTFARALWPVVRRKLDLLNRATDLRDLAVPPGNRLERLRGNREGQQSIRVNERLRLCFRWEDGDAFEVEITDYH